MANKSQITKFVLSYFSSNFNAFCVCLQNDHHFGLFDGPYKKKLLFISERDLKGTQYLNFPYLKGNLILEIVKQDKCPK